MAVPNPNWPATATQCSFDVDPVGGVPNFFSTWDDITNRVVKHDQFLGRQYELGAVEAGTSNLTCRNDDEALSPGNAASLFNSGAKDLLPYRRIQRVECMPAPLTGNWINDSNQYVLYAPLSNADANFEDGTLGHWKQQGGSPPTLSNDSTHVFNGTKAMKVTYAATPTAFSGCALIVPVFAGVTVTWAARVYLTANLTVAQCNIGGVGLGGSTSAIGSFQVITQTWTPTLTGTDIIQVVFAGTGAGSAWVDAVMLETGAAAHVFTTSGPTLTPTMTGYIERYPNRWDNQGFYGWTDMVVVDALALIAKNTYKDVLTEDMMQDAPGFYYPLWEPAGALQAANVGPLPQNPLLPVASNFGATVFGQTGSGPGVDQITGATFTAPVGAADPGPYLTGTMMTAVGGNTQSATFELWFNEATVGTVFGFAAALSNFNTPASSALQVGTDGTNHVRVRETFDGGATYAWTITSPGTYTDGLWHHVVVTEAWAAGTTTATVYVDGVQVGTTTGTATSAFYPAGLMVGWCPYGVAASTAGAVARVAFYPTVLSAARILSHYRAGTDGFNGELTGARITRLLGWAGWVDPTAIDAGSSLMQAAAGLNGINARDALQQCSDTDQGIVFAAQNGQITFYGRDHYYLQTTALVIFGENADAGEIPYTPSIAFDTDPQYIANEVTVERPGGPNQYLEDAASKKTYSHSPLTYTTYTNNDADALGLTQSLLNRRKDAHQRLTAIAVNPSANPSAFATILTLKIGDRVTVNRRTVAGTYSGDYFIERIQKDVAPDSYVVSYQLSPVAPYQAWIIGDNAFGVVGATSVVVH